MFIRWFDATPMVFGWSGLSDITIHSKTHASNEEKRAQTLSNIAQHHIIGSTTKRQFYWKKFDELINVVET